MNEPTIHTPAPASNDLIVPGKVPANEYGTTLMFNVPNPPSDVAQGVTDEEIISAIDRHSNTSARHFNNLPDAVKTAANAARS